MIFGVRYVRVTLEAQSGGGLFLGRDERYDEVQFHLSKSNDNERYMSFNSIYAPLFVSNLWQTE